MSPTRSPLTRRLALALAVVAMLVVGLATAATASAAVDQTKLVVYTTTSLNDSGLIANVIQPAYQTLYPGVTTFEVHAVGSGQAITAARTGLADVLLVHSPADEAQLIADGVGTLRLPFAYNYFVIVGPPVSKSKGFDPAHVHGSKTASGAFKKIAAWGDALVKNGSARKAFTSRGDASGTNKKELALWFSAHVTASSGASPTGAWYETTGQGMAATLTIANEHKSYTLTDIATWLTWRKAYIDSNGKAPFLTPLLMKRSELKNQYSVILLDPDASSPTRPDMNSAGAARLAAWLVSGDGQKAIGDYGKADFGRSLFFPNAYTISDPIVP